METMTRTLGAVSELREHQIKVDLQLGVDMVIAAIQEASKPIIAALVKRLCRAGVKKSLYGLTAILRCPA